MQTNLSIPQDSFTNNSTVNLDGKEQRVLNQLGPHSQSLLTVNQIELPNLSDKKYTVLHFVKDCLLGVIQYIFTRCLSPLKLHKAEQLSVNHINLYAKKMNNNTSNHAALLNANFSMLEANGANWNNPFGNFKENYFARLISNFKEENFELVKAAAEKLNKPQESLSLREILTANNKHILALPINVESAHVGGLIKGRHWTVIHFNFQTCTIAYLDSVKPNSQAKKVQERLSQTLEWLRESEDASWQLDDQGASGPSILTHCKQWDSFNCGVFAIQFTALAGAGKTYHEINDIPFSKMYRQIEARRLDIIDCVRNSS